MTGFFYFLYESRFVLRTGRLLFFGFVLVWFVGRLTGSLTDEAEGEEELVVGFVSFRLTHCKY